MANAYHRCGECIVTPRLLGIALGVSHSGCTGIHAAVCHGPASNGSSCALGSSASMSPGPLLGRGRNGREPLTAYRTAGLGGTFWPLLLHVLRAAIRALVLRPGTLARSGRPAKLAGCQTPGQVPSSGKEHAPSGPGLGSPRSRSARPAPAAAAPQLAPAYALGHEDGAPAPSQPRFRSKDGRHHVEDRQPSGGLAGPEGGDPRGGQTSCQRQQNS